MTTRRGTTVLVVGVVGLGLGIGAWTWRARTRPQPARPTTTAVATSSARSLAQGDRAALAALAGSKAQGPIGEAEAAGVVETLAGLRLGFAQFGPRDRAVALTLAARLFDRFAAEPAPSTWLGALGPIHNVLTLGLADADVEVRVTALAEIGRRWTWTPGRQDMLPVELNELTRWKEGLYEPTVACLAHAEPRVRAAAVQCLAALPLDGQAAPAVALINDDSPGVRLQVLAAFAGRRSLLTEDAILPRLHDPYPDLAAVAATVLKGRGLSPDQVGLCKMIAHPKADLRASAIPLLTARTDIDPVVWLVHLSRDPEEQVRLKAVEALSGRVTPEAARRLEEIVALDPSSAVRAAAVKLLPARESTAALPPLPGSPSLNPKAN